MKSVYCKADLHIFSFSITELSVLLVLPPFIVKASFCGTSVTSGFLFVVIFHLSLCILVYLAMTWTDLTI